MLSLDGTLFEIIHGLAGRSAVLDWFAVFSARFLPYFFVPGVLAVVALLDKGRRLKLIACAEAALAFVFGYGLIAHAIRFFYPHLRPFAALGFTPLIAASGASNSFPSGHATALFALAIFAFFHSRRWGSLAIAVALINGVARVYVGVHWPSDIVGGALVALFAAYAAKILVSPSVRELHETKERD